MAIGVEPGSVFVEQMRIATAQYIGALAGVSRNDALRRPGNASNPAIWIAGHLVYFRSRLAGSLGDRHDFLWGSRFATGSRLENVESYPELQEFRQMWLELDAVLRQRIATYTADMLAAAPPVRMASADGTLGGALATFAFHEVYHIGQLGYLRKWLGYPPLFEG
jgi:DinB family protein